MYRCEDCRKVSKPGEKLYRRVTEWKIVTHTDTYKDSDGKKQTVTTIGKKQIVKEKSVCKICFEASLNES